MRVADFIHQLELEIVTLDKSMGGVSELLGDDPEETIEAKEIAC
jgi:hypothetical protein